MIEIVKKYVFFLLVLTALQSCISSHIYEDVQTVGKGNRAMEASLQRAFYTAPPVNFDNLTRFYANNEIGTGRARFIYGVTERTDFSVGLDFPVGLHASMKHQINTKSIRHLHGFKMDVFAPVVYYFQQMPEKPLISVSPSYLYTFRYDDLFSFSANASVISTRTNERLFHLPGIAAGIQIGDVLRFNAGISYFDNFGFLGAEKIQYLSVEAGIKFDLDYPTMIQKTPKG